MFDYLQKFNNLPKSLRDKVSSPEVMRAISDLEIKYLVDLAAVIMKVMTKTLAINDLVEYFVSEFSLSREKAEALKLDILKSIFYSVKDYLGLEPIKKEPDINDFSALLVKEANLSLPSEDLYLRLKNIVNTYLKGVRNLVDTKNSLMKKVEFGGLNLSQSETDRIFRTIRSQELAKTNKIERDDKLDASLKEEVREILKEEIKTPLAPIKKELNEKLIVENKIDNQIPPFNNEKSSKEKLDKIIMEAEAAAAPLFIKKTNNVESIADEKDAVKVVGAGLLLSKPKSTLLFKDNKQTLLPKIDKQKLLPELKENTGEKINIEPRQNPELKNEIKKEAGLNIAVKDNKNIITPSVNKDIKVEIPAVEPVTKKENFQKEVINHPKENKEDLVKKEDYINTTVNTNINFNRPQPISSKPRMDDIKPVVKIMSPIDELKFLDLINFRRLGENVNETILKIFNKIKLLEKDGYDKMVLGVRAWRQSEVNRLYVKMGQEAIMKGISLKELITDRQKKNQPHLKIEEINAISHLNSRLSF